MRPEDLELRTKLIQLAEEGVELSHACLKMVRVIDGDTPVRELDAKMHLLEEIADVMLCSKVVTSKKDDTIVSGIMAAKYRRWEDRLRESRPD